MAVTLRYFIEVGNHAFQHITASICGGIYARVYCISYYMYDAIVVKKVNVRYLDHLLVSFLFFSNRVVNRWNLLDQQTVDAPNLNAFKNGFSRIRDNRMGFFMDYVR